MSPQSDTSWSQEGGIIGCQAALPATSDAKSVAYIFAPGKPEKDVVATVGNAGLQADTFISKSKRGTEEVASNPPVVGPPSLRPVINQGILEDRDKRKALNRVGKKRELRQITGLLNNDMVLEKPTSARELLLSNMITISRLDLTAWPPTLCNKFKRLLTWKSQSEIAKAKVTSNTSIRNVVSTEADDPSRHSRILASAGTERVGSRLWWRSCSILF